VLVDCRDLAVMAATLANRGVNPLTGRRALAEVLVDLAGAEGPLGPAPQLGVS
jgi:glutaminase